MYNERSLCHDMTNIDTQWNMDMKERENMRIIDVGQVSRRPSGIVPR